MKVFLSIVLAMAFLLYPAGCAAPSSPGPQLKSVAWVLDKDLCEPETVLLDPELNRLVVSNICGFTKNGKGYLSLVNLDGSLQSARWVEGLNAPAGMARLDRRFYVVDIDRVHVIDLDTGEIIDVLGPDPEAKAFNDIAIDKNGGIYVSDSGRGAVLKITGEDILAFPNAETEFKFANGLHAEGDTLYLGGEKFWAIDLNTGMVTRIDHDGIADIDGIESDGERGLSVSIVGGNVWHLPRTGDPVEWTAEGLSSTNHAYLPAQDLVIVPTGYDNTIIAFKP